MRRAALPIALMTLLSLGACVAPPPPGPSVMALPGQGKNFEAFQQDDAVCRQFAAQQTGGVSPSVAATQSGVGSSVVGTAVGAGLGAAIGSFSAAAGPGAVIGAAAGLLAGSAIGANNAAAAYGGVQQFYDVSYTQCMFAHGNTVQPPPSGFASYPYPYPAYPYPYAYPGFYGPAFYGPSVVVGFGGGWGWHGGGWHGGGWHH